MKPPKPMPTLKARLHVEPPPGMQLVTEGLVLQGDFFFITLLDAWAPVPKSGWNSPITETWTAVARGTIAMDKVDTSLMGEAQ